MATRVVTGKSSGYRFFKPCIFVLQIWK
uniref:Uncharacterized protein n=1 Tax=Arundo donax TaxID=35708 RepID=A0A0A8XWT4_ARUDO